MVYPEEGDAAVNIYLGRYETEILDWIEAAVTSRPRHVIDIGAADGYYAVGFKHALPQSEITAFELSREARKTASLTAARNGCNIDLRGSANARQILKLPAEHAFVLCDCEGAEVDILTPEVVHHLRSATVVVELHDGIRIDATGIITRRFAATHDIELRGIDGASGPPAELAGWSDAERAIALGEHRATECRWARLTPRL